MKKLILAALLLFAQASFPDGGYYPFGDMHWKAPVATSAALPAAGNAIGDARIAKNTGAIYVWTGSSWIVGSGSTGASGASGVRGSTGATGTTGPGYTYANEKYVDNVNGSDSNNCGVADPCLTIQAALNKFGSAANTTEYTTTTTAYYRIHVMPGIYTENLSIPTRQIVEMYIPSVKIIGNVTWNINGTVSSTITQPKLILRGGDLRSASSTASVAKTGITGNLSITGSNMGSMNPQVHILQSGVTGTVDFDSTTSPFPALFFAADSIIGAMTTTAAGGQVTLYVENSDTSTSTAIGALTGTFLLNRLRNVTFTGTITVATGSISGAVWSGVRFSGTSNSLNGHTLTVDADATSWSNFLTAFSAGANRGTTTQSYSDRSQGVGYTPTTSGDWTPVPTTVLGALDTLAARSAGTATTGATGATGAIGASGASGTNGSNGSNGAVGASGASGTNGSNGSNGAIGATGQTGAIGASGASGSNATVDQGNDITNLGLATSVAANALTVALKQKDGSTNPASGSGAVNVSFRSSTATTGGYTSISATGAVSVVIPASTTLGMTSGNAGYLYVYAVNNAGTLELGLSGTPRDTGIVLNTVAISGGTNTQSIYTTTARTGVAVVMVGRFSVTEATAGTWASNATEVTVGHFAFNNNANLGNTTTFNSSGTYNVPVGVTLVSVTCAGGGGGGAGGSCADTAGTAVFGNEGNTGSDSSFGSLVTCKGGTYGSRGIASFTLVGTGSSSVKSGQNGKSSIGAGGAAGTGTSGGTGGAGTAASANTGAGGGGGGGAIEAGNGPIANGGFGGSGAPIMSQIVQVTPGQAITVTVGGGGAAGTGGSGCSFTGGAGGAGGSGVVYVIPVQ